MARALSVGMVLAAEFSAQLGMIAEADAGARQTSSGRGRPADPSAGYRRDSPRKGLADADALLALMAQDKKVKRGKLTFILLRGRRPRRDRQRCRAFAGARLP